MATQTENLGLSKPDTAEGYDVGVFNANADAIDNAVGALQRTLGDGTGGGLGDKVDAVKTDTEEIKSIIGSPTDTTGAFTLYGQIKVLTAALTTANQNIATLLTQNGSVKAITYDSRTLGDAEGNFVATIPATMNADKVVIIVTGRPGSTSKPGGVGWQRSGNTVTFYANSNTMISYQFVEFY